MKKVKSSEGQIVKKLSEIKIMGVKETEFSIVGDIFDKQTEHLVIDLSDVLLSILFTDKEEDEK